jgi:exonuclease VII small subunit
MTTSDFLCGCLQVDRLERRVTHLEHDQLSDADASRAKENALMLLQRAREDLARARAQLAQLMHT